MDRKQVLKNMKKQKKNYEKNEETNLVSRFVMTIGLILVLLIALYLFVGIFITKTINFNKEEETKKEVKIDNSTILLGQLFDQSESTYYVLVYDVTDEDSTLPDYMAMFKGKHSGSIFYVVDSSKAFNKNYLVEKDSNKKPTGYNDLKVKSPTLIRITNKKVSEYYEGFEDIKNVLKK
jgi:hypothetical protein